MRTRLAAWLEQAWFTRPGLLWALLPLEWLFAGLVALRRLAFKKGWRHSAHPGVPVVVVGNITVGGTGKTPVLIALANALTERGFRVAVVSRGYGGSVTGVEAVTPQSPAARVGDEAVLIARETAARVYVGRDRLAAARLAGEDGAGLVLSDDGLQHYRMQRDIEVVTCDAQRGFGNGHLLPVGPLREPLRRLGSVDFLLQRGGTDPHSATYFTPRGFSALSGEEQRSLEAPGFGPRVHAFAAIARPERFFDTLRSLGLEPVEHARADHQAFSSEDFRNLENLPIVTTAKDAVKWPAGIEREVWVLDMDIRFPEDFVDQLLGRLGLHKPAPDTLQDAPLSIAGSAGGGL